MNSVIKTLIQIFLVVVVLASGTLVAVKLIKSKKAPAQRQVKVVAPLVKAEKVSASDIQVMVTGDGTVRSRSVVKVVPQVAGRIIACHPNFVNGGFFKANEPLITIDPRDYEAIVESAEASVAGAQVALDRELAEAAVAKKEWDQLHPNETASPLVLRQPQVRQATAQLKAANAQLQTAKLNLERTVISMPFDGRIVEETIDAGQYLTPGQPVATVYGTKAVEIMVPLKDSELAWFDVPLTSDSTSPLTQATVTAKFAGQTHTWNGTVVRTEARIDPISRMVNVVLEVNDPFVTKDNSPPLTPGMFVDILIAGRQLKNVIQVPRTAIHQGKYLWVANGERLHIKEVGIARFNENFAFISSGINEGDIVITDSLDTVTDNMGIRILLPETQTDQEAK